MSILIAVLLSLLLTVKLKVEKAYALFHIALHLIFLIVIGQAYAVSYLIIMFFSAPIQIACLKKCNKERFYPWFSVIPVAVVVVAVFT